MNTTNVNPDELTNYARQMLCQSINLYTGAECIAYQGLVFIRIDGINAVFCEVIWCRLHRNGQYLAQIGFQLIPNPPSRMAGRGTGMLDMLAGWGDSPQIAVENGVAKWMHSAFFSMHSALSLQTTFADVVAASRLLLPESATNPILQWHVFQGPVYIVGNPENTESLRKQLQQEPPFVPTIENWLIQAMLNQSNDLHWLKMYLGKGKGQLHIECQFNNEERSDLTDVMRTEFLWPEITDDEDTLSFKQYFVIVPA